MAREMNVVPYDSNWPVLFRNEKAILASIFGDVILEIQHFGSTSIVGMTAKPTIDVMITVGDIEIVDQYNDKMIESGYIVRGEQLIPGRRYFVRLKGDGENHLSHIHMYGKGNPHIADELMFRDFLGIDKDAFLQYEKMKLEVSKKYLYSPGEYQDAKYNCVMEIMKKAKSYYATEY